MDAHVHRSRLAYDSRRGVGAWKTFVLERFAIDWEL